MATEVQLAEKPALRWPDLLAMAGYLLLYLLLDWVSYIRPLQGLNITPWNPQPALAIALLIWSRNRLWLVWVGLLAAEVVVRGIPGDWWTVLTASLALSWIYAAIARTLIHFLGPVPVLASLRNLAWFTAIAGIGSLLCGMAYVAVYAAPSLGSPGFVIEAIVRYWIGDLVGLLVTLPILLIAIDPIRRGALVNAMQHLYWLLVVGVIGVLLWAVLGHGGGIYLRFFYLLFIPVILTSAVLGVLGAVLAASLTQLGLIVAVQSFPQPDLTVFELQVLMAAITMTGLLVGVLVDEKSRTAEALRDSMRLATAGQMAASLAHELSQPLTALSNYARACQMLVAGSANVQNDKRERINEVTQHIVTDANRATQVIKRLRDLFRTGATQLRQSSVPQVVEDAVAIHRQRAAWLQVSLETKLANQLPTIWIDTVQIGIVLRNLIDNALYAASSAGAGGQVEVKVARSGTDLLFEVCDSGPGIDGARLSSLFETGTSDKPGGMGMGLSICRAIVDAHGGRLWAVADSGGHFCFTLPLDEHDA